MARALPSESVPVERVSTHQAPFVAGDRIDGKYVVEGMIGEGGFGVVLKVRHEALGEPFAIKLMLDASDPVMARRFHQEARAAANIDSEHVAKVFDVGSHHGVPFMVMELLEGCDLHDLIAEQGALSYSTAVEYVLQACEALACAHALGIVHRDIKPSNLFLTLRADGSPLVKLLDFGISKAALAGGMVPLTQTGAVLGSPHFMSPEQLVSSSDVDARADIWSLGATLYNLLAGRLPFDGRTLAEVLAAVMRDDAPALDAELPEGLRGAVMRCLNKDREERFATIGDLASALVPHAPLRARSSAERVSDILEPVLPTMRQPSALESAPTMTPEEPTADEPTADEPTAEILPRAQTSPPALGALPSYVAPRHIEPRAPFHHGASQPLPTHHQPPPAARAPRSRTWLWFALGVVIALAAVVALWLVRRDRRAAPPSEAASNAALPFEVAVGDFDTMAHYVEPVPARPARVITGVLADGQRAAERGKLDRAEHLAQRALEMVTRAGFAPPMNVTALGAGPERLLMLVTLERFLREELVDPRTHDALSQLVTRVTQQNQALAVHASKVAAWGVSYDVGCSHIYMTRLYLHHAKHVYDAAQRGRGGSMDRALVTNLEQAAASWSAVARGTSGGKTMSMWRFCAEQRAANTRLLEKLR